MEALWDGDEYMAVCEPCVWTMTAGTEADAKAFVKLHKIVSDNHKDGIPWQLRLVKLMQKFKKGVRHG